jgi:hypothetical protein
MTATSRRRLITRRPPAAAAPAALALAVLLAACGGSAGGATLAPGATPTPSPVAPGGGGPADPGASVDPGATSEPGPSDAEPTFEEASITHGERTMLDVDLLVGEMTWDGIIGTRGFGDPDRWNINVDILLRRSEQHGGLVFASGSRVSVDWEGPKPEDVDLCQTYQAHWTGAISTPSGETIDSLSDPNPIGLGIVREGLDAIGLDISVGGSHEGEWCTFPGVNLSCPQLGGNKPWATILMDPVRLELTCTDVSPATDDQRVTINATGLIEEADEVPTGG